MHMMNHHQLQHKAEQFSYRKKCLDEKTGNEVLKSVHFPITLDEIQKKVNTRIDEEAKLLTFICAAPDECTASPCIHMYMDCMWINVIYCIYIYHKLAQYHA